MKRKLDSQSTKFPSKNKKLSKTIPYRRVLLKISGEALMGKDSYGISRDACVQICKAIQDMCNNGVEVGVVVGGGNIFRGLQGANLGLDRTPSDQMGMLATVMNGIALSETLKSMGVNSNVLSAINCYPIVEQYRWQTAIKYLEEKRVVIFVGGTGSPYFTTDTAAALRASEIQAEILIKATKVDGIYSKDPMKYKDAKRYEKLSYQEVLSKELDVMDATSVALCMKSKIPIFVCNIWKTTAFTELLYNKNLGTIVS